MEQVSALCGVNRYDLKNAADRHPDVAATWINCWLQDGVTVNDGRKRTRKVEDIQHLVRCFLPSPELALAGVEHGVVRAIRSDCFKLGLDVSDILGIVLKVIEDFPTLFSGKVDFEATVDDSICRFTLTNYAIQAATKVGDIVLAGIYGQTSDIGCSSATIESRIVKLACLNGMKTNKVMRKAHLGSKLEALPSGALSERTKKLQTAALVSELYDAVRFCFNEVKFKETVAQMDRNLSIPVTPDAAAPVFTAVQQALSISDEAKDALYCQFLSERFPNGEFNRTKDGIVQSLTATARQIALATTFEKSLAYEDTAQAVFNMPADRWESFVTVARNEPKRAKTFLN